MQLQIGHRAPHWLLGIPFVELEQVDHVLPGLVQLAPPAAHSVGAVGVLALVARGGTG